MLLQRREKALALDRPLDEAPRLLLDLDQLRDVRVLEAGPGRVQAGEHLAESAPVQAEGPLLGARQRDPQLQRSAEVRPRVPQGLRVAHRVAADHVLLAVRPDHRAVAEAHAGLEHVDSVVTGLAGEQRLVVSGEALPVGPAGGLQPEGVRGALQGLQERAARLEALLASRVHEVAHVEDEAAPGGRQQRDGGALPRADALGPLLAEDPLGRGHRRAPPLRGRGRHRLCAPLLCGRAGPAALRSCCGAGRHRPQALRCRRPPADRALSPMS
mmetsp:Transcript_68901/g.180573  ORF Transcript_68901/g.180573 Transcript_68901/m.180573 type:complete len:271 (+) Transcript_68901:1199-2011(+)